MLSDVTNFATGAGILFLVGLLILVIAAAAFYFGRGKGARMAGVGAIVGVFIIVLGIFTAATTNITTQSVAPPATTQTINTILATSPALLHGVSWNSVTNILSVDVVYNDTSHAFCTVVSFTATHGCGAATGNHSYGYFQLPLNLIRTDVQPNTFSFATTLASIASVTSVGSTPQVYSPDVGYVAASGSSPGQWQTSFSAGTTAGQHPTVAAPQTVTNLQTDGVAVQNFSSKINILTVDLPGNNGTSAPATMAQAVVNYTAYPMVLQIANSSPATVTINVICIGWTT